MGARVCIFHRVRHHAVAHAYDGRYQYREIHINCLFLMVHSFSSIHSLFLRFYMQIVKMCTDLPRPEGRGGCGMWIRQKDACAPPPLGPDCASGFPTGCLNGENATLGAAARRALHALRTTRHASGVVVDDGA